MAEEATEVSGAALVKGVVSGGGQVTQVGDAGVGSVLPTRCATDGQVGVDGGQAARHAPTEQQGDATHSQHQVVSEPEVDSRLGYEGLPAPPTTTVTTQSTSAMLGYCNNILENYVAILTFC